MFLIIPLEKTNIIFVFLVLLNSNFGYPLT